MFPQIQLLSVHPRFHVMSVRPGGKYTIRLTIRLTTYIAQANFILFGSEDSQIIFIKTGPSQELLTRPQSVEVEQIDPFDDVQEDEEENCSDSECTVNLEFY